MNLARALAFLLSSSLLTLAGCTTTVIGGGGAGSGATGSAGGPGATGSAGGPGATGSGGFGNGGSTGSGNGGGTVTAPAPPSCGRTGADPGAANAFARLQYGFAASWTGTAKPPYGWTGPGFPDTLWTVQFDFTPGGHYSGHCLESGCVALYYGSDEDVSGKTYTIDDLQASGAGVGTIKVYFGPNDWNTGDLKHISLSSDLTSLSFEFWKDGYGPVVYDLHCTN